MLRLLLDEHISPDGARGLRRRHRSLVVHAVPEWHHGQCLGQDDVACLSQAATEKLTLVTYDRRTVPPLLKAWAEEGRAHAGVIFIDETTISPSNTGNLVSALSNLYRFGARWDWLNRICFLQR